MTHKRLKVLLAGLALLVSSAVLGQAGQIDFEGTVHYLDKTGGTLSRLMQEASRAFEKDSKDGLFFIGYIFTARHGVHMGDRRENDAPYTVNVRTDEIRIRRTRRRTNEEGYTMRTEADESGPAGILLLNRVTDGRRTLLDTNVFDPDRVYRFEDIPLYWLGEVDTDQSFQTLRTEFQRGGRDLQSDLVFLISLHDSPQVNGFLQDVALGEDFGRKVRKNAIFWLGNLNTPDSLRSLKLINSRVDSTELKKQVVFAYSLNDQEEAVQEMIAIARQDDNREVRKNAIFWLGQKASREAVKALKDVVQASDEDTDLKKSAVFAISQLPKDQSVPLLISIAKSHKNSSVRKNAIFWLGQTGDEEALKFFEDILLMK
jgi:hypothetical protein